LAAANIEGALGDVYSSVFARPFIDLAEPTLVHPPDFVGREALIDPGFVDGMLGRN
jgi:hypothetical protein